MTELQSVQERLKRLERQNQRWRIAVFALLLIMVVGAARGTAQKVETTDGVVKGQRFELYQESKLMGKWENGVISMYDSDGRLRSQFHVSGVSTWDQHNNLTYYQSGNAVILIKGDPAKQRLAITAEKLVIIDDDNHLRAKLDQSGVTVYPLEIAPRAPREFTIDTNKVDANKPRQLKPPQK